MKTTDCLPFYYQSIYSDYMFKISFLILFLNVKIRWQSCLGNGQRIFWLEPILVMLVKSSLIVKLKSIQISIYGSKFQMKQIILKILSGSNSSWAPVPGHWLIKNAIFIIGIANPGKVKGHSFSIRVSCQIETIQNAASLTNWRPNMVIPFSLYLALDVWISSLCTFRIFPGID